MPNGWYPDPSDPLRMRYWEGARWTEHVRAEERAASAEEGSASPASKGLAGLKRLAGSARSSAVAHHAVIKANAAGRAAMATATDADKRRALIRTAAPTIEGALDGAKLRNRKGKITIWRVARATTRPRKTVTGASQGIVGATGSQLKAYAESTPTAAGGTTVKPFRTIAEIAREWAFDDRDQALARWRLGVARFAETDGEDINEAREIAVLLSDGIKYCTNRESILPDDDLIVQTTGNVLAAILSAREPSMWDEQERRILRLALAVSLVVGIQPEELGGNGELEVLFNDVTSRMRMAMAVSRVGWSCDLAAWFEGAA